MTQVPSQSFFQSLFVQTLPTQKRPEFSLEHGTPPPPELNPERTRKRLLLALAVLLVTLLAVIVKNWDFWFPPASESESAASTAEQKSRAKARRSGSAPSAQHSSAAREHKAVDNSNQPEASMSATTERAALPDLQVEVVAGNQTKTVRARNNSIHVDLASPGPGANGHQTQVAPIEATSKAGDQVQVSADAAQRVSRSVAPDYPLLARQMKVQGAVILQALISRDGNIEELHIVSGPEILAAAAREAVRQWHFRPYYQSGQPVQTQARITVNFTISTN